jgi:hypothetical protein
LAGVIAPPQESIQKMDFSQTSQALLQWEELSQFSDVAKNKFLTLELDTDEIQGHQSITDKWYSILTTKKDNDGEYLLLDDLITRQDLIDPEKFVRM